MKKFIKISSQLGLLGLGCALISACGEKTADEIAPTSKEARVEHVQSKDGSVQIDHIHVSEAQRAQARNEYRRTNLVQLPVDAKYNATVFRITDASIADYENKAFIAPKLYSYGTQDGGKLLPVNHGDGTVTLNFNVIFLDGISSQAMTPQANASTFAVPETYRVRFADQLREVLKTRYGTDDQLSPLPGCPKQLTLTAAGKEYDVTPRDFAKCDSIQNNVPITVSLTLPEVEAQVLLEVGLYSNMVDLRGIYETKVSYPITHVSVKFNRSKIFNDLKAELGLKAWVVDADVKLATTKVIEHQLMDVVTQGDVPTYVQNLVEKVTTQFFVPFIPNPMSPEPNPCGSDKAVCLRMNSAALSQEGMMEFTWASESDLLSGQNYITSTKLKATPPNVRIGAGECDESQTRVGDCRRLTNSGEARETGLTVVNGNAINIEPDYMVRERRTIFAPTASRTDNSVCVAHHEVCGREEDGCRAHCAIDKELYLESESCHDVCDRRENQWSDIVNFSAAPAADEVIHSPVGQLQELYDGLAFEFHWVDQIMNTKKTMKCPLSAFPRIGDGRSLIVRVKNMPSCSPFSGVPGEAPMLYLVNQIAFPQPYRAGRQVTRWDGVITESPSYETFNPKVDFAGTLTILGYSFSSAINSSSL